jgi:CRP-like cAMP-binding protein
VKPTQLIQIPIQTLAQALENDQAFSMRWIKMLNLEIKHLRLMCERLSMKSIRERVLHLVDSEGTQGRYQLNTDLKTLASELGVTHEALYRTLAALEKDGLLFRDAGVLFK